MIILSFIKEKIQDFFFYLQIISDLLHDISDQLHMSNLYLYDIHKIVNSSSSSDRSISADVDVEADED